MKKVLIVVVMLFVGRIVGGYITGEPQVERFDIVVVEEGQDWGDFIGEEYITEMQALNPTVKELEAGVQIQVPVFK